METDTQKYSLWMVPKESEKDQLQNFVNELADAYQAPRFAPHLTLVANIFASDHTEYTQALDSAVKLAKSVQPFDINLEGFDYTDEEFRCLFLRAIPSPELDAVYTIAMQHFPQVADEHFRAMPHLSVLYGNYDTATKESIIAKARNTKVAAITFRITSFDLYLTNNPIESWQEEQQLTLGQRN